MEIYSTTASSKLTLHLGEATSPLIPSNEINRWIEQNTLNLDETMNDLVKSNTNLSQVQKLQTDPESPNSPQQTQTPIIYDTESDDEELQATKKQKTVLPSPTARNRVEGKEGHQQSSSLSPQTPKVTRGKTRRMKKNIFRLQADTIYFINQ